MLGDGAVNLLIAVPAVLGVIWSAKEWVAVGKVKLDGHPDLLAKQDSKAQKGSQDTVAEMVKIAKTISDGAMSFLSAEYTYMAVYIVVFSGILMFFTGVPTTVAFVVGAVTSMLCGWIGMKIAVATNVKTTHQCWRDLSSGFEVAIQGGSVMGLSLVSIGVAALWVLTVAFRKYYSFESPEVMYEAIAGYGLGGSSVALFGRVGGGIYTKAADVGADLSGKNDYGLEEDDYRNPACIADNVGDNVGDIAGMGADLFGSFAESTCAALVLAASSHDLRRSWCSQMYPVLISSVGIVVGLLTLILQKVFYKVREQQDVEKALKGILVISTVLMSPVVVLLSKLCLPAVFSMGPGFEEVTQEYCAVSIMLGLWSGLIIGYVTEFYTSHSYTPVREIAETQKQSAATGIIYGLALGYLSCIVPVICLGITILIAHTLCGMFGVALGALGMLGTMTLALTIDAYGPISDNAGGIAEMSGMDKDVRKITDCLDAAGNTTAAIGKGFAIGSAALVSLALFGAFCVRARVDHV